MGRNITMELGNAMPDACLTADRAVRADRKGKEV